MDNIEFEVLSKACAQVYRVIARIPDPEVAEAATYRMDDVLEVIDNIRRYGRKPS